MDLLCQRCGEPYDQYHVRHEMTAQERIRFLDGKGCPTCADKKPCDKPVTCGECLLYDRGCTVNMFKPRNAAGRQAQAAIRSVLGDDLDAVAAEMEDFGLTLE